MYNDRQSGFQIINIKAVLELSEAVGIELGTSLEVSLDCAICLARRRTVKVYELREYGNCIKTKHQLAIKINSKTYEIENNSVVIAYQIEYWYAPFYDRKQNEESQWLPTWGRINFSLTCPKCRLKTETFTQTNLVRPRTIDCECGFVLAAEKEIMPVFEKPA